MKRQTIVIIGAGSTGLSTALNLAKSSNSRIIVLDKSFVSSGQSGQCCGLLRSFYNTKEMAVSANKSMKQIKKMCDLNRNLEFEQKGLLVIQNLQKSESIKKNVRLLQSLGINAKYIEKKEIEEKNPFLKTNGICAGLDEEAGYINPLLVVNLLSERCKELGVKIIEKANVTNLKIRKGSFYIKIGTGNTVKADKVFNATAAFTNKMNAMLGFQLPVKIIKTNNCFYRLPIEIQRYQIAIADFVNLFYLIPHKEFIDVGGLALDLNRVIDPENKSIFEIDRGIVSEYLQLISKRIKGAEKSAILGGFGSCIDVTPDYYPILSSTKVSNYYCATGFSGTGFKHFPMVGKLMAEIILGEESSFPDLISFFRYDRFDRNKIRKEVSDSYFINKKI